MASSAKRVFSSSMNRSSLTWWDRVKPASVDPITSITEAFLADPNPHKINLGVGAYRDDEGKPVVLQCVKDADVKITGSEFLESVSATAGEKFVEESLRLVHGNDFSNSDHFRSRFAGIQALSGTGACRLFAEFQSRFYPESHVYLPDPTWSNHHNIWKDARIPRRSFRYYDRESKGLNFTGLMDDIKRAPKSSFFLLHPCAHNPTGIDPNDEQWREISHLFKVKNHFPFFDMAYQGLATGDLENDAKSIRIFVEDGHLVGCAQSFAKNMGLYGHRVGCLSVLCSDETQAGSVKSQLKQIARAMYSSPPIHGLLLVSTVLGDPEIKSLWVREVKDMVNRIREIRSTLRGSLEKLGSPLNWDHITSQVGMFCFSGLSPDQVDRLAKEFHVYMTRDGRISMAGVTSGNVSYLANAIHQVTTSHQ